MTGDLTPVFERLERWLAAHAPQLHAELTPGAEEGELDELEAVVEHTLPDDFRALYRRHGNWDRVLGLFHLPLPEVQQQWENWRELKPDYADEGEEDYTSSPPGAIQTRYINLGWIPLLYDWSGNFIGVDLAPGPRGTPGQVINFGRDEEAKVVIAPSLGAFLREYVTRLESGQVEVTSEEGESTWLKLMPPEGGAHEPGSAALYPGFSEALRDR